jgi:hypothetical protein
MRRESALPLQPTPPAFQPAAPYEVRCYRCQCSFAPETKRCVHCGERLGGSLVSFGRVDGAAPAGAEDEARPEVPSFARGLLWMLSAAAAVVLSALQTCGAGQ